MKICGIIAEYNPFHTGHQYHIQQARTLADNIIVVMSGHLMQRGELAKYSKWDRACAALLCGADLVIELPGYFSCASAERFATGGVRILQQLNCVDMISFGSESGDIQALRQTAALCNNIDGTEQMRKYLKQGCSYPRARQLALGSQGDLLSGANNTLGVEYIKAAMKLGADFTFHTLKRINAPHIGKPQNEYANSAFLRQYPEYMNRFIPGVTDSLYQQSAKLPEQILLYRLRSMSQDDFAKLPDVTEGLEHRLFRAAQKATSIQTFFKMVKTKRYTHSRLRRIAMYALLNVQALDLPALPKYARVLGFTPSGQKLLSFMRNRSAIYVSPNFPQIAKMFPKDTALDIAATDLFSLCLSSLLSCGQDFIRRPIATYPHTGSDIH